MKLTSVKMTTRHIIPISGKDSLCTALVQTARKPDVPYEYFFSDTGTELPETYAWLDHVEEQTGWHIQRIGKNLEDQIEVNGFLPSARARFCTRQTKIKPMEEWLDGEDAAIYYGLRADEDRVGLRPEPNITVSYPLKELGIDLPGVWTILARKDLLPPSFFWPALYDTVVDMIGPEDTWEPKLRPWERQNLFDGRSRSNCYFCFFQRQYEWVWLHDTHPELFNRAAAIESDIGGDGYTWTQGYSLHELSGRRDEVLNRRARIVAGRIEARRQHKLFAGEKGLIDTVQCGMHCGK